MPNLVPLKAASRALPAIVAAAEDETRERFLEFFASTIRNPHTRRAYRAAVQDFLDWCETAGVGTFREVRPLHVAAWIEQQSQTHKAPTAKQRLAAMPTSVSMFRVKRPNGRLSAHRSVAPSATSSSSSSSARSCAWPRQSSKGPSQHR
jgi:Phage integrase, N-terminal SAM-like domain